MKIQKHLILAVIMIAGLCFGSSRYKIWFEAPEIFGISSGGASELVSVARDITLDRTDFQKGDYSILYTASRNANYYGFKPAPFLESWSLCADTVLSFYAKIERQQEVDNGIIVIFDENQNGSAMRFRDLDSSGDWQRFEIALSEFGVDEDFDFDKITSFKIRLSLKSGDKVWFDDIHFVTADGEIIGVTDKSIDQRIAEERATREARAKDAFEDLIENTPSHFLSGRYAKLYLGIDVDKVNEELLEIYSTDDLSLKSKFGLEYSWHLFASPMMYSLYFDFGSNGRIHPGRLYKETEDALLALLWERTKGKNDIQLARQSTWWMTGSENHDVNGKVTNLLASQIFANHPDYADKVLPNKGTGGGSGYWFHRTEQTGRFYGPEGRADFSDGKEYTAKDHYEAWVEFFDEYLRERAKRGFFLEYGSPTYMKYTIGYLSNIYHYCDDQPLRELVKEFLDLFWCDWAQDVIDGIRGGAKTREHGYRTGLVDSTLSMATFFMGGNGHGAIATYSQLSSDYEFPKIVWKMALDRSGMGSFEYSSRKIGEEEDTWPRPFGTERTMLCDTDSRFVRYSWVTPDYIMGTQMDHPAAIHSHLSVASRWHGVTFATSPTARVFSRAIQDRGNNDWRIFKESGMYRSVQEKNVKITQQARSFRWISPDWFPHTDNFSLPYGVYFAPELERVEYGGWIFVKEGRAFLAVRIVQGEVTPDYLGAPTWLELDARGSLYSQVLEDTYTWNRDKTIAVLKDKFSPIIFEAATKDDYETFEDFQAAILENELKLQNTVVPGWYILIYTGAAPDARQIYFNAANNEIPMIDGEYINYSPEKLFYSPYMNSDYKSGKIEVRFGEERRFFDFN